MAKARTKRRALAPVEEDARQRFLRLGQPRMVRALNSIKLIGNLAAPQYNWNETDVNHIRQTLLEAVGDMLGRFEARLHQGKHKVEFHFAENVTIVPAQSSVREKEREQT